MKRIKTILQIGSGLILLIFVFRGCIYRSTVNYIQIGERETIKITDRQLIDRIDKEVRNRVVELPEIIEVAHKITSNSLSFTRTRATRNPNELLASVKANCIGYSAMFNSISTYLIHKNELDKELKSTHLIGEIYFLGIDLHQLSDSPFFKDHDYNQIKDLKTGEIVWMDPTIRDYLSIDRVTSSKE